MFWMDQKNGVALVLQQKIINHVFRCWRPLLFLQGKSKRQQAWTGWTMAMVHQRTNPEDCDRPNFSQFLYANPSIPNFLSILPCVPGPGLQPGLFGHIVLVAEGVLQPGPTWIKNSESPIRIDPFLIDVGKPWGIITLSDMCPSLPKFKPKERVQQHPTGGEFPSRARCPFQWTKVPVSSAPVSAVAGEGQSFHQATSAAEKGQEKNCMNPSSTKWSSRLQHSPHPNVPNPCLMIVSGYQLYLMHMISHDINQLVEPILPPTPRIW